MQSLTEKIQASFLRLEQKRLEEKMEKPKFDHEESIEKAREAKSRSLRYYYKHRDDPEFQKRRKEAKAKAYLKCDKAERWEYEKMRRERKRAA